MRNNSNNGKGSSMAIGVIAFAIIVAIIVIFFTISANSNGGSPAKPVNRPPITCMEHIKTNADLVNCLVEYDEKY